ncbi:hypothetical protein PIIN_04355 [Serendipita indica DSM 11827]|uniref:Cytoplasmic protein n=1 Tax=Serendipita indica (strain DSM 11827) TaxID=1109443 RepID=G4TGI3_SERID|nr:hypothetical protein PIIN_04355 [Serendipita indica DSM 11827]
MPPPLSADKALAAILPQISAGQAYEAHQKARTFASRYSKAGAHDVAISVLYESATALFKAGQLGSGTDLSVLMLEMYENKEQEVDEASRARLTQLISLVGGEGQWRKMIVDRAVAWSARHGSYPSGDPSLHGFIGALLAKEHDFVAAEPHLLASGTRESAKTLAQMLFAWSRDGAEPGTYASKGVIPFLLTGNVLAARTFMSTFLSLLITARPNILATPSNAIAGSTANPIRFDVKGQSERDERAKSSSNLQQAKQAQEMWVRLCGSYQSRRGLVAQPVYREALGEIGTLFFDLPPPRMAGGGNPLQDMMASFLGGSPGGGPGAKAKRTLPAPAEAIALD